MKRLIAVLILAVLPVPGMAAELPTEPREVSIQETLAVDNYAAELTKIIQAITTSNMPVDAKERSIIAAKDGIIALQKDRLELEGEKTKQKGSFWSTFFDITWKVVTLGASVFAGYKAAQ